MGDKKIKEIKKLVDTAEIALQQARNILSEMTGDPSYAASVVENISLSSSVEGDDQIIEGVFDGQQMIGPDGKKYSVPANYASKSKLVEGDLMKLTILQDGTFLYKQIGPQLRDRVKATLIYDNETGEYRALTDHGDSHKLLTASVTYFKVNPGDKIIVLLPKGKKTVWAALENIFEDDDDLDSSEDTVVEDVVEEEQDDTSSEETEDEDEIEDFDLKDIENSEEEGSEMEETEEEEIESESQNDYLSKEDNAMPVDFDLSLTDEEDEEGDLL
jgi:hypothetical protein